MYNRGINMLSNEIFEDVLFDQQYVSADQYNQVIGSGKSTSIPLDVYNDEGMIPYSYMQSAGKANGISVPSYDQLPATRDLNPSSYAPQQTQQSKQTQYPTNPHKYATGNIQSAINKYHYGGSNDIAMGNRR